MLLLRIGVVAFAAFLAAAVVQRTLLGNFALKLGPLEVPDIARTTEDALAAVGDQLREQGDATEEALRAAADAADAVTALSEEVNALRANTLAVLAAFSDPTPAEAGGRPDGEEGSSNLAEGMDVDVQLDAEADTSEGT